MRGGATCFFLFTIFLSLCYLPVCCPTSPLRATLRLLLRRESLEEIKPELLSYFVLKVVLSESTRESCLHASLVAAKFFSSCVVFHTTTCSPEDTSDFLAGWESASPTLGSASHVVTTIEDLAVPHVHDTKRVVFVLVKMDLHFDTRGIWNVCCQSHDLSPFSFATASACWTV